MSTALYRRYRPETFDDVIGQEHVTAPLMTALQKNRVNHAYLFSGPRGCGKTTSARILARCLNCVQGPTAHPCGVCQSCQDLARDGAGSLDVIEMDAASHGGVDHARDLRERATFAPVRDRYKIFIIDEAHMVTREGFNALLKIVEEPPEHIKFIFATTEPNKVLGTIRSRTHHYPFRLVAPEVLRGYLTELCAKEDVQIEQGVLPLVVRAGGGSVRDSLSVLDQLMAGADDDGITYDLAVALLGFTHAELLDGVVDAFAAGDSPAVFHAVDRVIQTGQDPRRFVEDLLERFRDLIIIKAVPDSAGQILHGMPEDQIDRMRAQATQLGSSELSRAADISNTALTDMTGATSPQLHLELLCARILLPTADDSSRGVNARVDRLERRVNMGEVGAVPAPLHNDPAAVTTPETPAEHLASQREDTPPAQEPAGKKAALSMARGNRETSNPQSTESAEPQASPAAPVAPSENQPEPAVSRPATPEPVQAEPNTTPSDGNDQVTMIERSWADIITSVGKYSKVGQATFRECRPTRFQAGTLYVNSTGPGIQSRVERFASALSSALKDTLGIDCRVALDDGPSGGPGGGTVDPSDPAPNRATQQQPRRQTVASANADGEDWPTDAAWNQAAQQAQSVSAPAPQNRERPASTAEESATIPEGPRGGESAWQQHGTPLTEEPQNPQWSDDESGESFSGWQVAQIPSDDPSTESTTSHAAPETAAPESSASSPAKENAHGHLRVISDDTATAPSRGGDSTVAPAGGEATEADTASSETPAQENGQEVPAQPETSEPAHDWSMAARSAGAPGKAVDGRTCGWRYSGPESEEGASEHPSKWGQRTPHLTEVGGTSTRTDDAPASEPSPRRTDKSERHLHAVHSNEQGDGAPGPDSSVEESNAPENSVSADPSRTQESSGVEASKLSFRERHAAAIAAGSTQNPEQQMVRGRHGDVPVDPNAPEPPEDDWENFEPSSQDEDVEDSAVFGQAAIETILGGRVLEERPHHRG